MGCLFILCFLFRIKSAYLGIEIVSFSGDYDEKAIDSVDKQNWHTNRK